jgi:4-amino-4-deoxy-L-arabinose transferase-like glycosyltransferase
MPAISWIIAAGVVLRLVIAAILGPSVDETYLVVVSRDVALGYADHPPMAMWLVAAARWLTGSEAILWARLPFIALSAGTIWLVYRLGVLLFDETAGLLGALALSLTPLVSAYLGVFVLTDGPLFFFVAAAALCLGHALFAPEETRSATIWWLAAGALLGLALLAKYTAIFLPLGAGLYLVSQRRHRRWLFRPVPWLALAVAALVFAPVLVWNAGHGWISFAFQGARAGPGLWLHPARLAINLAIQAVITMPPIWVGLIVTLGKGARAGPANDRSWFLTSLAVGPIVFFALVWLLARQANDGFHWAEPGYLMLYPLYGHVLAERARVAPREVRGWFAVTAAAFAVVLIGYLGHTLTGWAQIFMPERAVRDAILVDQVDWRDLRQALAKRNLLDPRRTYALATEWPQCVRADYALAGALPVVCLDRAPLLAFEPAVVGTSGRDAVIISVKPTAPAGLRFASVEPLGAVPITSHGVRASTVWLFLGKSAP